MLTLSGTKLHFSTAYHPQSDGQTEVRNRGLEQYLRAFAADRPSKWANFLPWAELALNCFHHEGLGTSPFRALYGREPPPALIAAQPSIAAVTPSVAELIQQRGSLLVDLRKNLERAQQRMRDAANRHRRDVQFEVGDKVLLKLQQYRQHSVARPLSAKLARRYYGPFVVTEKIGQVAYRLELPQGARIHDVFHVSLLKPFVEGAQSQGIAELPLEFVGNRPVLKTIEVLDRCVALREGRPVEQILVRWSGSDDIPPSWEPVDVIGRRFPSLLLEDKEHFFGGGVDTGMLARRVPETDDGEPRLTDSPVGDVEAAEETEEELELVDEEELVEEQEGRKGRPKRLTRRPDKYRDYVSH